VGAEEKMITFKEYLTQLRNKKKTKGNQYPVKGANDVVDHSVEKTHSSYKSANSLRPVVTGVGPGHA